MRDLDLEGTQRQLNLAVKAQLQIQANRVRSQIAYSNAARRELACKARKRKGEVFQEIGRIPKSYAISLVVGVSEWRGVTTIELHEYERTMFDGRPSGRCMFLDARHLPELIGLLELTHEHLKQET
jgi:hypothetical protein